MYMTAEREKVSVYPLVKYHCRIDDKSAVLGLCYIFRVKLVINTVSNSYVKNSPNVYLTLSGNNFRDYGWRRIFLCIKCFRQLRQREG